jgi:hypothetical protein
VNHKHCEYGPKIIPKQPDAAPVNLDQVLVPTVVWVNPIPRPPFVLIRQLGVTDETGHRQIQLAQGDGSQDTVEHGKVNLHNSPSKNNESLLALGTAGPAGSTAS